MVTGKDNFVRFKTEEGEVYAQSIFSGQQPRSRVMKDVITEIEEEIDNWDVDKSGIMLDCREVIQHQSNYYLTAADSHWQQKLVSTDAAVDFEIDQVYKWFKQLVKALQEVEADKKTWPLIKLNHLRQDERGQLKLLPPKTADYLLLYSEDLRPVIPEECYRPPELFQADEREEKLKDEKTLVFNLGVIVYYLLTGEPPYNGRDKSEIIERVQKGRMVPAHILRPELGQKFSKLLSRCLQPEPNERPALQEVQAELRGFKTEELYTPAEDINSSKIARRRRLFNWKQTVYYQVRRRWPALAILAVLIIGIPLIFLTAGPEQFITSQHSPLEVTEYFYQAINEKNVTMLDDTGSIDMGELRRMVSETHVMETVQQLYQAEDVEVENGEEGEEEISQEQLEDRLETLFGVEELEIEQVQTDPPLVETEYIFFFQQEDGVIRWQAEDKIIFQEQDDRWQIAEIKGFMDVVRQGALHELEETEQLQDN